MVIVYCENRIAPEKQEEYLEKVRATGVVEKSNQETGNISYELVCSAVEPGKMLIVERWESRKHMPGHLRSAHFAALSKLNKEYGVTSDVKMYTAEELG